VLRGSRLHRARYTFIEVLLRHEGFRRLCRARDLLLEDRECPLSIRELAREVRISPFHLIRQFEAVFGLTPHQFRQASRLDLAKHLLAAGEHSVTDVCMEVGFSSLGSFSALFTARVGETPSAYRRRMRPMVSVPGLVPVDLTPGCLMLMGRLPASAFSASVRNFREA
jgi:AraC-like DNA-binding protein